MASKTKTAKTKASKTKATDPTKAALAAIKQDYPHIRSVVETSAKTGRATRVIIDCQEGYEGIPCEKTREIATQDAFQVTRCHACQRHYLRIRRRKSGSTAAPATVAA